MYKFLILAILVLCGEHSFAQSYIVDSVELNSNTDMVFYDVKMGTQTRLTKKNWDIGFANDAHEYTIRINELMGVRLWKTNKKVADFAAVTLADTTRERFNSESFMLKGAFDEIYKEINSNHDNQTGWSVMKFDTHNGEGDTVFIIKTFDNKFKKLYISYFVADVSNPRRYVVHIADIAGTNEKDLTIPKNNTVTDFYYSYYNLTSEAYVNDVEAPKGNYDLTFREYQKGGNIKPMGILANNSYSLLKDVVGGPYGNRRYAYVPAYQVNGDPSTAVYNNSLGVEEGIFDMNYIGMSWLNEGTQQPIGNTSYFVRDQKNSCIWHFMVNNYSVAGGKTKVVFSKKNLGLCPYGLGIQTNQQDHLFSSYISKGSDLICLDGDIDESNTIVITNLQGEILLKSNLKRNVHLNNLERGLYIVNLLGPNQNPYHNFKLVIE